MKNNIYLCIRNKEKIVIDEKINFPNFIKRIESKKAYTLIKKMMEDRGLKFDISKIKIGKSGKPYFSDNIIKFNYSHSKHFVACAISYDDIGIDIEDEFIISKEGAKLYLNGISDNLRFNWVMKEAYLKLKENFDDEEFKKLDISRLNCHKYIINNDNYICIVCYIENKKVIFL